MGFGYGMIVIWDDIVGYLLIYCGMCRMGFQIMRLGLYVWELKFLGKNCRRRCVYVYVLWVCRVFAVACMCFIDVNFMW